MDIDFSKRSREALLHAYNEASRLKSVEVTTEHLFLGIVKTDDQTRNLLHDLGLNVNDLIDMISLTFQKQCDKRDKDLVLSKSADKIMKVAYLEAKVLKQNLIEPYHILLSILREPANLIQLELETHGMVDRITKEIRHQVESGRLKSRNGLLGRWF